MGKVLSTCYRLHLNSRLLSNTLTGCNLRGPKAPRRYADGEYTVDTVWPQLVLVSLPVYWVTAAYDPIKLANRITLCMCMLDHLDIANIDEPNMDD